MFLRDSRLQNYLRTVCRMNDCQRMSKRFHHLVKRGVNDGAPKDVQPEIFHGAGDIAGVGMHGFASGNAVTEAGQTFPQNLCATSRDHWWPSK